MSHLIKNRKNVDALAAGLRALGWSPSVGTISYDGQVRGYAIGVVVKIGDDRLKWAPHARNPIIDFFSIANIASGASKELARKPVGFAWAMSGVDTVQLNPDPNEAVDAFITRLRHLTPPQLSLFNTAPPPAESARTAGMRM